MVLSISPITDIPQPPLKTDPTNFASRADAFLGSLPDFVTETNAAITEMNKITSGLDNTEPIAAYNSGTTYNFPDVCAGSDGQTYRCVDTGVVGVDPTTDDGTNWVQVGGKGGLFWSVVAVDTDASKGNGYLFDNSSAVHTLTLPASPSVGDTVAAGDLGGDFDTYALTIARNGSLIMGQAEDLTLDVENQRVTLVYSGAAEGWVITELEPNGSQWEYMPYATMHVQWHENQGTVQPTINGGDRPVKLNYLVKNDISGASLGTDVVTLPPGTYRIHARHWFQSDNSTGHVLYFQKSDGSVTYLRSPNSLRNEWSVIDEELTLNETTTFRLRGRSAGNYYSGAYSNVLNISGLSEIYADLKITKIGGNYAPKPIISAARYSPMAGLDTTGGVMGFNLSKTGANQVTVTKGVCLDSNLSVALTLTSNTAVNLATTANQLFHIFVVRLTASGLFSVRAYTTEAAVASDTEVDAFRWIGWWKNDGSGAAVAMTNSGEYYLSNKASDWVVSGSIGTTFAKVDHSAFIPESRVELIEYGVRDAATANDIYASDDGINTSFYIGRAKTGVGDTSIDTWSDRIYANSALYPYLVTRQFASGSGTLDLLIHAVKVRR